LYWTSLNLKIDTTPQAFYKKFVYKLTFDCNSIGLFRHIKADIKALENKIELLKSYPFYFKNFLGLSFGSPSEDAKKIILILTKFKEKHSNDIKVRIEHSRCNIYFNDPALINKFLNKTEKYFHGTSSESYDNGLISISLPASGRSYKNNNVFYRKKLPYDKFKFKVILSTSKKQTIQNQELEFLQWAQQLDTIYIPHSCIESIHSSYSMSTIYFYCIDSETLNMAQFLLSGSIKNIQQFELIDK